MHYKYYFRMREVREYRAGPALMGARRSRRCGRVYRPRLALQSFPGVGKQTERYVEEIRLAMQRPSHEGPCCSVWRNLGNEEIDHPPALRHYERFGFERGTRILRKQRPGLSKITMGRPPLWGVPHYRIYLDGTAIDPSSVEDHVADYTLPAATLADGRQVDVSMTVVEWTVATERALFLCDENGFALHRMIPGIQAPGFTFTAYLKSEFIRELSDRGDLVLEELSPELRPLVENARTQLRSHFRIRSAGKAGTLVEQWKSEEVYPYVGTPRSVVEEAERQVFDVLALNVHAYLPDFEATSRENRKLSFRLLRTAIETSPEAVQLILRDVLALPQEKREELVQLLEHTSLDSIINAAKVVADRLDFLQGLELLVFDAVGRQKTLERRHLHKIIAEHTWLFGEEFNLTVSDRSLTSVLRRHLETAEIDILDDRPVVREDGSEGIVDLMLSRVVPQPRPEQNEHLIVELKRPSVRIGNAEATQVEEYATAIVRDERFRNTNTRWEFWAVGNEMTEAVRLKANQTGRPTGLLSEPEGYSMRI